MGGTTSRPALVSGTTIDPAPVATRWSADPQVRRRGWLCALGLAVSLLALVPAVAAILLLLGGIVALVRRDGTLPDPMPALRFLLVGCQALTIVLTWGLWQTRAYPPVLEVSGLPLPQLSVGVPLLATLGLSLFRPRIGVGLFTVVLGYSFLADQTRLQPEVISLGLLLVATTLGSAGPMLARAHLASMWCWAGVHKLLSLGFLGGSAPWIFGALPFRPAALAASFGWFVAGLEISVGVLVAVPRTRRLGVALALILHGTVLYVLSPLGYGWNESVWPWNLAIPLAAVAVFWPRSSPGPAAAAGRRATAAVCALLALFPVGFYLGVVDAYPAHNLYSDNTAAGYCAPACTKSWVQDTWSAFAVPLPPEPRLFRAYFDKTCAAGQVLTVVPRQVRVLVGLHTTTQQHRCAREEPAGAASPVSPAPGLVVTTSTTLTITPAPPPGVDAPLVRSFATTRLRRDLSGWVGMRLLVGPADVQVTALGRWVAEGNRAGHRVKVVDASTGADVAGAVATVETSGAPTGSFSYAPLAAPSVLRANSTYYLVSEETAGGDSWYDYNTQVVTGPGLTDIGAVFSLAVTPAGWQSGGAPGMAFGPLSLLYR